jgi:hypothetical protein
MLKVLQMLMRLVIMLLAETATGISDEVQKLYISSS